MYRGKRGFRFNLVRSRSASVQEAILMPVFSMIMVCVVGLIVWPIFIFQLLNGNYFQVGFISTLIIAVTAILQLVLGRHVDLNTPKEKVLKWGSILYSFGWIIKIFIATAFHVFIIGAYHSISSILLYTPFNTLNYEIMADQGHYIDEFTVLREMAVNFGKVIMVLLIILISFFFDIQWVFILAAMAAFTLGFLRRKEPAMIESLA